ncbi:S8 family serine peptidase [Marivirga arenosa]|uniref:S8 family serine peptidase n=1 Tax=Marivirga arenosa TaxID=3059076 RepID=A0AA51R6P6_9BACT|nr:S8 family serine peptidase [Marivirga sp. ABR2-2]WMN06862.1 S8 family serine peptidase [Marivirga sp. ABR2-2]
MNYILPLLLSIFIIQQGVAQEYVPGVLVVKLKEDSKSRKPFSNALNIDDLEENKSVKNLKSFSSKSNSRRNRSNGKSSLDNLFKIEINDAIDEKQYINYLKSFDNVKYVEKYPNVKPLYVPNDPEAQFGQAQFHLAQINIYDAWNTSQGNEDVVIGIIDTGADLDHEDLNANLYLNAADPIDGVDNDGDGYIDNYYGWDFADEDNSPESDGSTHGTGVTGIAAAATDNNTGIAGVGFKTKFMPIKIFQTQNNFSRNSFEAIIYAADQGCDVINLSWGSSGRYSQFAQDIINYAVLEKDVVVVAAAGNTNAELDFFPASYDNVLSVGYVNSDDSRNANATFSDFIDIVAPGVGIYTTENGDTYGTDSGSSYAAPMVAGAAALLRSVFPEWNALQVMEQLRVTSDDIYDVASNRDYLYQFGKGRLNVFKALADFSSPSIRISDVSYTNGLEEAAYFGDTLSIQVEFTNYLESTENINVSLTTSSPYVEILQGEYRIDSLGNNQSVINTNQPFKVILSEDLPEDEALNFRILFEGEFYNDYQSFQIQSSPKIQLFTFNNWKFGLNATGNFGRSQENPFNEFAVYYNNKRVIDNAGVILYAGLDSLRRNSVISPTNFIYAEDFESFQSLKRYNDQTADLDVRSVFNERDDVSNPLGIYIRQRFLAWNDAPDILINQFKIENRSVNIYDSLYFTLFTDYAIDEKTNNSVAYDSDLQLSYAYDEAQSEYVGLTMLSKYDSVFYAFDMDNFNGHTTDLENDSLKQSTIQYALVNSFSKLAAGQNSGGNNVGALHGALYPQFKDSSSINLSFAILRADNLDKLKALVSTAKEKDSISYTNPPFGRQVLICEGDSPVISAPDQSQYNIYTSSSSSSPIYSGDNFAPGQINQDTTFYYVELDSMGIESIRKRLVISIQRPIANFTLPSEPILIDPDKANSVIFSDSSELATSWNWEFSNGITSSRRNPSIIFDSEGSYSAQLIITSQIGCKDTLSKTFEVFERLPKPNIGKLEVCENSDLLISDPDLTEITIYSDSLLQNQIFKGSEFIIESIQKDTLFYIRNEKGDYFSTVEEVEVQIVPLNAKMNVSLNLQAETVNMQGYAVQNSPLATNYYWLIGADTVSTEEELYFDLLALKNFPLKLITVSQSNCIDSVVFNPDQSPVPTFDDYYLCQSEAVVINSNNSNEVYYFRDSTMTEIIGRGANVSLDSISDNMSIYAVNVSNYKPSEPVEVPVFVSDLSAEFSVSRDTINLAFDQEINLISEFDQASEWQWKLDGNSIGSTQELIHTLTEPGVFILELSVKDTLGCSDLRRKQLVVFDDPLLGNKNELKSYFSIYPNPANKFVHLTGRDQFEFDEYSIIDQSGKEVLKSNNTKPFLQTEIIDVSELEQGAYYLIIRRGKLEASFLFVIKR